jgi:hypothetical protein
VLLEQEDGSLNRLYIGESVSGLRRMWDLPIGESHHVVSRIPPEAWARVIVVRWPLLLDRLMQADRARALDLQDVSAVRALNRLIESYLNRELTPVFEPEEQRMGLFNNGRVRSFQHRNTTRSAWKCWMHGCNSKPFYCLQRLRLRAAPLVVEDIALLPFRTAAAKTLFEPRPSELRYPSRGLLAQSVR